MRRLVLLTALLVFGPACRCNLLTNPQSRAAALPESADVAVGASHDVLVVACQDRVTLVDFVFPVAATALFVGLGRLDAAFYLPDALVQSAVPQCKDTVYTVSGATLDGDAFELETTPNMAAYKLHAKHEGESTFHAQVAVGKETIEVSTTLRAWKPDHLDFAPQCDRVPDGAVQLPGHVPAAKFAFFTHRLFHGTTPLTGYGYFGVSHPRFTLSESGSTVSATFTAERGPFTVTSEVDPAFSLELTTYDLGDYDPLALQRVTTEAVFAGAELEVLPVATVAGGKTPCVDGFVRHFTVETPAVCKVKDRGEASIGVQSNWPITVQALAPGTCRLTLTLDGTAQTASLQFPVYRSFEATPLPDAAKHVSIHFLDLWVFGPDDVIAAGWKDEITGQIQTATLRRSAGAWGSLQTTRTPPSVQAVHGDRVSGTAIAVGRDGHATRWNGAAWQPLDAGTQADLYDVWVNGSNDAFAAGNGGTFLHFDGAGWTAIDAGTTGDLRSLWGDGAGNTYFVGAGTAKRFDGAAFTDLFPAAAGDAGFLPYAIGGSSPTDLWIFSHSFPLASHWDGTSWKTPAFQREPGDQFGQVYSVGDGFAYVLVKRAVGSSLPGASVERFDGMKSVSIPLPEPAIAIGGFGNDVFVLTKTALLHYRHDPADVFP